MLRQGVTASALTAGLLVWAGDAPAFDLSCEAANEVCANALAQCAQEGLAEACDQEQERCDEAAAICAAVSTFLAGLDTDQLDEIACQEAASFSVGSGLFDIKDIRLGNVLNPLKRKKELKRIVKMAAKIGLGYGLATTCTPILVGEDYRGGSAEERVTRAVEALQMRSIPVPTGIFAMLVGTWSVFGSMRSHHRQQIAS